MVQALAQYIYIYIHILPPQVVVNAMHLIRWTPTDIPRRSTENIQYIEDASQLLEGWKHN